MFADGKDAGVATSRHLAPSVPQTIAVASSTFQVSVRTFLNILGPGHTDMGRSELFSNSENPEVSWRAMAISGNGDLQVAVAQQ